jgi:hypothetical protein
MRLSAARSGTTRLLGRWSSLRWRQDNGRGFDPEQMLTILSATVGTPSHLISGEMKAARRT